MAARLLQRRRKPEGDPRLGALKLRAMDVAFERFEARSLADLGAVWGVDAGYSFYALDRHGAERVVICDDTFSAPVLERERRDPRVQLVQGHLGAPEVVEAVGEVDAILMFDILLHQVRPDWDQMLGLYGGRAQVMALAGPWWNGAETVRLLDLGREAYLESTPMTDFHAAALDRLDEIHPDRGRRWRDVHDIWQWGITDADLRAKMHELGFRLVHYENLGPWRGLKRFDDSSYVFAKAS